MGHPAEQDTRVWQEQPSIAKATHNGLLPSTISTPPLSRERPTTTSTTTQAAAQACWAMRQQGMACTPVETNRPSHM